MDGYDGADGAPGMPGYDGAKVCINKVLLHIIHLSVLTLVS